MKVSYSKTFSPVEKRLNTTVPTKYNTTETLKTSSQEPENSQRKPAVLYSCPKDQISIKY